MMERWSNGAMEQARKAKRNGEAGIRLVANLDRTQRVMCLPIIEILPFQQALVLQDPYGQACKVEGSGL